MRVLRIARETDAGAVGGILSEFIDTTPWMPRVHTRAEDLAHAGVMIERGWVWVAQEGHKVLGFSACNGHELNALYVTGDARGRGVGTSLLQLLQHERPHLRLYTFQENAGAQRFYLRHGFKEISRTDGAENDEKLPDILYEWVKGNA